MWKMLPCSLYDIPVLEEWLGEQARKGRLFAGFWGFLARFEKGEPRAETYRLEPGDGSIRPDEEKLELYEAAGWEFLCSNPSYYDLWVFRASRPDPAPLHTDPVTQGIAYERLQRRLRRRMLPCLILFAVMACLCIWKLTQISVLELTTSAYPVLQPVYWTLYSLLFILWILGDLWTLRRLVVSLKAGIPMEHRGPRRGYRRRVAQGLAAVLLVTVATNLGLPMRSTAFQSWPDVREWSRPLPYVSVRALGADPENPAASADWRDGVLASDIYDVWDGDLSGGDGKQSFTQAYRLRLEPLSGALLRELREEKLPAGEAAAVADSPFDECWYAEAGGWEYLALRQGRWVLWTRAQVPERLLDHLEDFAAALGRMEA